MRHKSMLLTSVALAVMAWCMRDVPGQETLGTAGMTLARPPAVIQAPPPQQAAPAAQVSGAQTTAEEAFWQ